MQNNQRIINYLSTGKVTGEYSLSTREVEDLRSRVSSNEATDYDYVEMKTEYFKLFFCLNMDDKIRKSLSKINKDADEVWEDITDTIVNVLQAYIVEEPNLFSYYYAEGNTSVQLYFPNIIINSEYALVLRTKIVEELANEFQYLYYNDYDSIIDSSVFKDNGIRLLYQKTGNYRLNNKLCRIKYRDTLDTLEDKIKHLKLTSIRTNKNDINFTQTSNRSGEHFLDLALEKKNIKELVDKKKGHTETYKKAEICVRSYNERFVLGFFKLIKKETLSDEKIVRTLMNICKNYEWRNIAGTLIHQFGGDENIMRYKKDSYATIYTLMGYAKRDSPEKYAELIKDPMFGNFYSEELKNLNTEEEFVCDHSTDVQYVGKLNLDKYNTFIIKSGTGTGKTEAIIRSIRELVESERADTIKVLASRIVLAENIAGRFKHHVKGANMMNLNMKMYNEVPLEKRQYCKRMIQTPDSLYNSTTDVQAPDILFIDEIESLYDYVINSSTLNGKRNVVLSTLNFFIKKAKYVFLVDSNVTNELIEYIKEIRMMNKESRIQVIHNYRKTNDTSYFILTKEEDWYNRVKNHAFSGKKLFIGTDSKEKTQILQKIFEEHNNSVSEKVYADENEPQGSSSSGLTLRRLRVKVYNSDTCDLDKKELGTVNEEWVKYDIVICSPTILYGVDFNVEHFDFVYGNYVQVIGASSIYQQLNRARKSTSKEAYIFIEENKTSYSPLPVTVDAITEEIMKYREAYKDILEQIALDETDPTRLATTFFNKFFMHFKIEHNKCCNNRLQQLVMYLTEYGGKVFKVKPRFVSNYKEIVKEKKELSTLIKAECKTKLLEASVNKEDVKEIIDVKRGRQNTKDKEIINAYNMCINIGVRSLNEDLLSVVPSLAESKKLRESFKFLNDNAYDETDNMDGSRDNAIVKRNIVRSAIKVMFGDNGLFSEEKIQMSGKDAPKEITDWFIKNRLGLKKHFPAAVKNLTDKPGRTGILGAITNCVKDYFGGSVTIDKEAYKKSRTKGDSSQTGHMYSIDSSTWTELYLTKCRVSIENKINKNTKCRFSSLHGASYLGDFYDPNMVNINNYMYTKKDAGYYRMLLGKDLYGKHCDPESLIEYRDESKHFKNYYGKAEKK